MAAGQDVIAAGLAHRACDDLQDAEAGIAVVILDVVRPLAGDRGDRAHLSREAVLDVQGLPRGCLLVLGHAVGDLGRAALSGAVAGAWQPAAHVHQQQTDRATDREVGVEALAEGVVAGVDAEFPGDRPVHDDERSYRMRGGLDRVEVEHGIGQRLDGRDDHRHVRGPATRHHRVDCDALDGALALTRRQYRHHVAWAPVRVAEELAHVRLGRRHDRKPVGPALLLVVLKDRGVGAANPECPRGRPGSGHGRMTAFRTVSIAPSAFLTTSSSRMPPSGWGIRASGRSARPRFFASSLASCSNSYVPMTTVGIPRCSSTMAPWILHDVHDPQSALPTRTKSHVVSAARMSGDGAPAIPFSRLTTSRTPYCSRRRSATASIRVPALALLLSRMPTRLPSRLASRGARPVARMRGSAVGS